jgi:hypothetical protein
VEVLNSRPGVFGLISSVLGIVLLLFTFVIGYILLRNQVGGIVTATTTTAGLTTAMGTLLDAAVAALFLGIMGWVGSLLLLRGIEFMKVEKGVGVVTFKVEKGVGIVTRVDDRDERDAENKG